MTGRAVCGWSMWTAGSTAGKTRQNLAEAQAVVKELSRRAHDPQQAGYSVGVVTFNVQQQTLISDLLDESCKTDSQLESWAFDAAEPLFIKNLENVQAMSGM